MMFAIIDMLSAIPIGALYPLPFGPMMRRGRMIIVMFFLVMFFLRTMIVMRLSDRHACIADNQNKRETCGEKTFHINSFCINVIV